MQVVAVTERVHVTRPVPRGAHIEELAAVRDLAAHVQAAHCRLMAANEVDPAIGHQRQPFIAIGEELAHGQRRGGLLAEDLEPAHIFRAERVFHIERPVLLDGFAQFD